MEKKDFLKEPIKHIDIKSFDSTRIIEAMKDMSFSARDTAKAAELFNTMINDKDCTIILCIAGINLQRERFVAQKVMRARMAAFRKSGRVIRPSLVV